MKVCRARSNIGMALLRQGRLRHDMFDRIRPLLFVLLLMFYLCSLQPVPLFAASMELQDLPPMSEEILHRHGIELQMARKPETIVNNPIIEARLTDEALVSKMSVPFHTTLVKHVGLVTLWPYDDSLTSNEAIARVLQFIIATRTPESGNAPKDSLVTQEIRYQTQEAGEVFLVWGINGWKNIPEAIRPSGTVVKNGGMHTLMARDGDAFTVKVEVPAGAIIDYGFWISKARDGTEVKVWDANGYPPVGYQTIARPGRVAVVLATINLAKAHAFASLPHTPLVTQEIRYEIAEAGEVFLVWGINGWQQVAEAIRPLGTVVKDRLMHTPMARENETFVTKIQMPSGAIIHYGFLITKTRTSADVKMWDGADDFRKTAAEDGRITVKSKLTLGAPRHAKAQSSGNVPGTSFVTQEIRYRMAEAGEVFLVWGINGWQVVPEDLRPPGTLIKNDVMHTPMVQQGDAFVAKVQVPAGAIIHYGFLIPKTHTGAVIKAWDGAEAFHLVAGSGREAVEVQSTVTLDKGGKSHSDLGTRVYLLIVTFLAFNTCILVLRNHDHVQPCFRTMVIALISLTLQGLLLRLLAASEGGRLLATPSQLVGDEPGYDYLATALLDGHFFEWPARTPVYPLFLAVCYSVFGHSFASVLYVQAFVGAAIVPLTFLLARRFAGSRWALLAAGLVALHPALIAHVVSLYTEALYTPLLLVALLSLIRALEKPIFKRFALAGALLAITTLCRPTTALFPLVLPFLLPSTLSIMRKLASWAVYTGMMVVVIAPWSYHNYRTYHTFLPLSVTAGVVLWHGSPEYYHLTMEKERNALQIWDQVLNPARNGGHDPFSIEGDRYFMNRAVASIRHEPKLYLWYALQKLMFFWIGNPAIDWPSYAIFGFDAMRPYFSRSHIIGIFVSRLLPFVTLVGLIILRHRLKDFLPLLAVCGYLMVFHALTQSEVRYSEPLYPILMTIIAAAASRVWHLYEEYHQRVMVPVQEEG